MSLICLRLMPLPLPSTRFCATLPLFYLNYRRCRLSTAQALSEDPSSCHLQTHTLSRSTRCHSHQSAFTATTATTFLLFFTPSKSPSTH